MLTYELPKELIAQYPIEPRDSSRLLILDRVSGKITHQTFKDLPHFLQPGDCLVLNDTRVIPARLYGVKEGTGAKVELLVLTPHPGPLPQGERVRVYRCLGQPGRRLRPGTKLHFGAWHQNGNGARHPLVGEVVSAQGAEKLVRFSQGVRGSTGSPRTEAGSPRTEAGSPRTEVDSPRTESMEQLLFRLGQVPLPPYIDRPVMPQDSQWYQTVYARHPGAVAAPTAGLHFTEGLLDQIRQRGVRVVFLTLHVGWGTFKPLREKELAEGRLHSEEFRVPEETLEAIRQTRSNGGRVVAVGTTVVRALETIGCLAPTVPGTLCSTDLFIRPGFRFQVVDAMITNFHLPGTSLLYLVAAFAGEKQILSVYQEAIAKRYRFYSYGDAMLIA